MKWLPEATVLGCTALVAFVVVMTLDPPGAGRYVDRRPDDPIRDWRTREELRGMWEDRPGPIRDVRWMGGEAILLVSAVPLPVLWLGFGIGMIATRRWPRRHGLRKTGTGLSRIGCVILLMTIAATAAGIPAHLTKVFASDYSTASWEYYAKAGRCLAALRFGLCLAVPCLVAGWALCLNDARREGGRPT